MKMPLAARLPALLLALSATLFTTATLAAGEEPAPRIHVTGEGSVNLAPDLALLTLTVTRQADTAGEALKANSAAMEQVLRAMRDEGIAERDLQTGGFSIDPRYVHKPARAGEEPQAPRIVGYTVRNTLNVRVRDLTRTGAVLDTAVRLGVNEGGQIVLTNDDPSAAIDEARARAMKDALARAGTLAEAAGVRTGKLLQVNENTRYPGPQPMMARAASMKMEMADSVPVASGENTYVVQVNIAIAIEQ